MPASRATCERRAVSERISSPKASGEGLATSYSHMSRIAAASGQFVHRGDVIGFVGSSGLSTGPHLHYEVFKNGTPVNPMVVRTVGGSNLDKQERHNFNDRLRQLLTGRMG